jgi:putative phosphoesterase
MLLGIISDSHDNIPAIKEILKIFKERGVEQVIHAGDLVSPFTLEPFKEAGLPLTVILGNNEGERELIRKKFGQAGFSVHQEPFELEIAGLNIVVCHRPEVAEPFIGQADVVIFGHTHKLSAETREDTLVINPGELGGWLYERKTGVILELPEKKVEVLEMI